MMHRSTSLDAQGAVVLARRGGGRQGAHPQAATPSRNSFAQDPERREPQLQLHPARACG
jgi:hypothetical protein